MEQVWVQRVWLPLVVSVQDCAVHCNIHPDVRKAHLVLVSDEDLRGGSLATAYNVGLYLRAVWKAARGRSVWGQGWGQVGGVATERGNDGVQPVTRARMPVPASARRATRGVQPAGKEGTSTRASPLCPPRPRTANTTSTPLP